MSSIVFIFRGTEVGIPCQEKEQLVSIIERFCFKVQSPRTNLIFLCNGTLLNEQLTADKIPLNQNNKRFICVDDNSKINNPEDIIIKPNLIICPKCQESSSISFNDYKISLSNCKNGHRIDNINIQDFNNTQKLNLSKIICGQCKSNNMGSTTENIFLNVLNAKLIYVPYVNRLIILNIIYIFIRINIIYAKNMVNCSFLFVIIAKKIYAFYAKKNILIIM